MGLIHDLRPHPSFRPNDIKAIEISDGIVSDGKWRFYFCVEALLDKIVVPKFLNFERTDKLWETTCFEAFIKRRGHDEYIEYNFTTSGQWAAYHFADYRIGMRSIEMATPVIEISAVDGLLQIAVLIEPPAGWNVGSFEIGMSAIIEETDGTKSYWALAHPPGKPDFHHNDCFALQLEAPSAA